jgi:hypothetical protein
MVVSLTEIDRVLSGSPGFRIVNPLKIDESGVDPIGLRQLNLDLMDATVPGINNVTMHIRPYALMAWAWWKALHVTADNGDGPDKAADLVARYETIYAWAHSLAGNPFRGAAAIRAKLPLKGSGESFVFEGPSWEEFKKKRTSLMAPTEYGPSIKAIHFLTVEEGGLYSWATQVEDAIRTIDETVSSCIPDRLLRAKAPSVGWREVISLAEHLPIESASQAEKDAFRFLFYEAGADSRAHEDMRRRKASIDLLRSILPEGDYVSVPEIRRRLAAGALPIEAWADRPEVRESALLLSILQTRQLQRLATEAMMLWVERSLSTAVADAKTTEALVLAAHAAAAQVDEIAASASSVGAYMDAIEDLGRETGWPRAAARPVTDIVVMIERLSEAQRKDVTRLPGLALRAFGIVNAMTKAFRAENFAESGLNPLERRSDRLPMGIMAKRIEAIRDKPLAFLWRDVIKSWIIAQHVHWSAVRGSDGKKRLRIGLEGSGWIRVRPKPSSSFGVTPDRLVTLLSLGSECGLFAKSLDKPLHFGRAA